MTPLGGLDALFLHLETAAAPMHVGALNLLAPPAHGEDLYAAITRHVQARLAASPVFTRRLRPAPLAIANPLWVDAGDLDVAYHVQRLQLPPPGTQAQLEAAVAKLHAEPLDRQRPLWQFWLIEGLADGNYGWYAKVHHAAVDGVAGVALAQALLDTSPMAPAVREAGRATARRAGAEAPSTARVLGEVLAHNGRSALALARQLPALAATAAGLLRGGRAGVLREFARQFVLAPSTVFNRPIDAGRSIATYSVPLAQVRAIAAAHEATINDVVLAIVGGALRRLLQARNELPAAPLLAAMPVSLRESGDAQMNTQAWMMQASLATDIEAPVDRLRAIHAAAAAAKAMTREIRPALGVALPSFGLPWLLGAAAMVYATAPVAQRMPKLANVVVSNVPGPPLPLYLAGARLLAYWPLSIVGHGLGLNVTVLRYVDALDFGLVAARRVLPDLAPLSQAMRAAFSELAEATAAAAGRKRAAKRSSVSAPDSARRGKPAAVGRRSGRARRPRSA